MTAAAATLLAAGVALGRLVPFAFPFRFGPPAGASAPPPAPAGAGPSATALPSTADGAAAAADAAAQAAAARADQALAAAGASAAAAAALAEPAQARRPTAQSPAGAVTSVAQEAGAAEAAAAAARSDAADAAVAAQGAARRAAAYAAQAEVAARTASSSASQAASLDVRARADLTAWSAVRAEPPGYLGIVYADPPPGLGAGGCEVVSAPPGTPAAAAGLAGSAQRPDGAGDVIQRLVDRTDGGAVWPVTSCADFRAAMAQTRAGDLLVVDYAARTLAHYLLTGLWTSEQTQARLVPDTCPPPLEGRIVQARIDVTVRLSGPAGSATVPGVVDTGGAGGWFDAGLLNRLGFAPEPGSRFSAAGYLGAPAGTAAYVYVVPFPSVLDGGRFVALGQGSVAVEGVVGLSSWTGESGLGTDQLDQVAFQNTGSQWQITWPSCGA